MSQFKRPRDGLIKREVVQTEGVRGCSGKRIYTTYSSANNAAKWTRREKNADVHAYACRHCHKFHVGGNS